MNSCVVALARGELGKSIEKYLGSYGVNISIEDRPVNFEQRVGNVIFRSMNSRDVPWYVAERADYGITGSDLVQDYTLSESCRSELRVIEELGFGKGDLVLFGKCSRVKLAKTTKSPLVAVPYYYTNILRYGTRILRTCYGVHPREILEVNGSTEGFVVDGTADLGFDFTTYFEKPIYEKDKTTITANRLKILSREISTEAVLISNNSYLTIDTFERTMKKIKPQRDK